VAGTEARAVRGVHVRRVALAPTLQFQDRASELLILENVQERGCGLLVAGARGTPIDTGVRAENVSELGFRGEHPRSLLGATVSEVSSRSTRLAKTAAKSVADITDFFCPLEEQNLTT